MSFLKKVKEKTEETAKKGLDVGKNLGAKGLALGKEAGEKGLETGKKATKTIKEKVTSEKES